MNKIQSTLLYILVFTLSIISTKIVKNKLNKNKLTDFLYLTLIIFIPVFLAAIRYGIGTDYFSYSNIYYVISKMKFPELVRYNLEIGYTLLNKIIYIIFNNEIALFACTSFLTLIFITYTLKKYNSLISITFGLLIYYLSYYNLSYNGIRQLIAVSIVLYAYTYAVEKNFKKYFLWILIAGTFHKTALICLIFYILVENDDKKISYIKDIAYYLFIICSPLLMNYIIKGISYILVNNKYFISYNLDFDNIGIGFLIYQLPVILPVLFYKKNILNINKNYNFFINILLMQIPLQVLAYIQTYAYRMSWYGSIIQVLIVPITISSIKYKRDKIIVLLYYLIWYFFMFLVVNEGGTPDTSIYRSIWMK